MTAQIHHDGVIVNTLADVEATIRSFKLICRPAGRGRPVKTGTRTIEFGDLVITAKVSEACRGANGIGMAFSLFMDGKRTTLQKIAKAHLGLA